VKENYQDITSCVEQLFKKVKALLKLSCMICLLQCGNVAAQIDTLFYFAPPWVTPDHNPKQPVKFHVSSFSAPSTTVYIKQPASPFSLDTMIVMGPAQLVDVVYWRGALASPTSLGYDSLETRPANVVRTNGVRIRSTSKITVVYDEITITPNNPETYSLKGQNAFGTEFVCPFQTKWNNKNLGTTDNNGDGITTQPKSMICIVATKPGTTVWITPRCAVVGHPANITYSVFLPVEGACYTAENVSQTTSIPGQNLAGSIVVSDKPVGVTVSDDSVNPGSGSGQTCYDLMGDQIVPVELVGTDYIINRGQLNPQTGEAFFAVATQNFTKLEIVGATTTSMMLNKGDTYTHNLNSDLTYARADKNIYLLHASGYGCELGEALLPPLNCAGSDSVTFTRNNADPFFLNVLCKSAAIAGFTLVNSSNTIPIAQTQFTAIPATSTLQGGPFYGAQLGPFTTAQIPVNSSNLLFNSAGTNGFFAMGVFNGTQTGGTLFHYMSSFLRRTTVKTQSVQPVCAGSAGTVAVTGTISGAALTGFWTTSVSLGTSTLQGGASGIFDPVYTSSIGVVSTIYTVSANDTTAIAPTKTITLYLTSAGVCKNITDSVKLVINQRPKILASTGTVLCRNNITPIALNATVSNASGGTWSGGNGGSFGVPGEQTTYTLSQADINTGLVTLSLTTALPLQGCSNTMNTFTVGFINPPVVSIVPSNTQVCTNSTTLALNGNISGITTSGVWTGGAGAYTVTNTMLNPTYILGQADLLQNSITLTLTSTQNSICAAESATMQINIVPKPQLLLPSTIAPVCAASGSVTLSGTITGTSNQGSWLSGGTGSITQGQQFGTITATYFLGALDVNAGNVTFSLLSSGAVCPAETNTINIAILEPPLVLVNQNFIPVCKNAPVVLTGTISGYTTTGIWSTSSSTSSPGTFTPSASSLSGLYLPSLADIDNGFVILTLSSTQNGNCPSTSSAFTASFIPAPKADFVAFGKRCVKSPVSFSSTSQQNGTGALKFNWDFGDSTLTSLSSAVNPLKTFTTAGQYLVTLTVTGVSLLNVECPDVIQKKVTVKTLPVANFLPSPACEDKPVVFTNKSFAPPGSDPVIQWEWKFGDVDTTGNHIFRNSGTSITHQYSSPGSYLAVLTITAGIPGSDPALGCVSDPRVISIDVSSKPEAEFGMTNNPTVAQEPVYFSDFSRPKENIAGWYWEFGDGDASSEQAPSHTYLSAGLYLIRFTVFDAAGCTDTATKLIDVSLLPQVPAAFSPNRDGNNDLLFVKGGPFEKMLFRVYNNWGELLFETNDQKDGWDGKKDGVDQPVGVYVWTLVVDMYNNRQVKKNGDITLLR
jgi:gliding motility-associated-like protein